MDIYPKIEVGYSIGKGDSAFAVGQETARNALSSIRKHSISAVLVFASVSYDLEEVLRGIGSIVSDVPVLGTTTAGEICNGLYKESVVVVALASPHLKIHCALGHNVSQDWQMALEQVISSPGTAPFFQDSPIFWQELTRRGKTVIAVLFSPGNTRTADTLSYEILEELKRRTLGRIPIFGGASADDWRMEKNYVLLGQKAFPDSILLAIIETELQIGIAIGNGFQPSSFQTTVNSVEGHEILTMDGRQSSEVFALALGMIPESLEGKHLTLSSGYAFGISDPMGEYTINVASYTTPRGGIRFTQPVSPGTHLTLMRSQSEDMYGTGQKVLRKAMLRGGITDPVCALVCYCTLRPRLMGKDSEKEINLMRETIDGLPIVGFCSFGEQGVSDDGISRYDNAAVTALIFGSDLSYAANVAIENEILHQELRQHAAELEKRVEDRSNELKLANLKLEQDIVQRKLTEGILMKSERRLHRAEEVAHTGNWEFFIEESIVRASDGARIIYGLEGSEWQMSDIKKIPLPQYRPIMDEALSALINHGKTYNIEFKIRRIKDGEIIDIQSLAEYDPQKRIVFGVIKDITDRKKMEEELLKSRNLESIAILSKGIAHDFNNMLTSVLGFISLSKELLPTSDQAHRYLTVAESACVKANELTHKLEQFASGVKLERKTTSLAPLLQDSYGLLSINSNIKVNRSIPDNLWSAEIDERQIFKVMHELVENAIEAMPNGGVIDIVEKNTVVTSKDLLPLQEGNYIKISVKDDGIGISKENLPNIFELYFTTKQMDYMSGVGLGLALCYSIVKAHKGYIVVSSEPGKRTVVHVYLPASTGKNEQIAFPLIQS